MVNRTEWRFLQLTAVLLLWLLVAPLFEHRWVMHLLLQLMLLNALVVTLWANPLWTRLRRAVVGLWLLSIAGSALAWVPMTGPWPKWGRTVELASLMPVLLACAGGMLHYAFRRRALTADGIFATVAAYLLISFVFAQAYLLMLTWDPDSLQLPVPAEDRPPQSLLGDVVYFSLVTLATVGYGDMLPRTDSARALAVIEAVVGQFYVAVIVAIFVGAYVDRQSDRALRQ